MVPITAAKAKAHGHLTVSAIPIDITLCIPPQAMKRLTGACRLASYCKSRSEIFSTSARYKVGSTHPIASRRSTDD
jgi:hypothetical protein